MRGLDVRGDVLRGRSYEWDADSETDGGEV